MHFFHDESRSRCRRGGSMSADSTSSLGNVSFCHKKIICHRRATSTTSHLVTAEGGGCRRPRFIFLLGFGTRWATGTKRASIVRRSFLVPMRPPPVATPFSAYFTAKAIFLASA